MPAVNPCPDNGVRCYVSVSNYVELLPFFKKAFGAKEVLRLPGMTPKDTVHAEIEIPEVGNLYLADEMPEWGNKSFKSLGGSPVGPWFFVKDLEKWHKRIADAGGKILSPPERAFYGDESFKFADPSGQTWSVMRHVEDMSNEEMVRRNKLVFEGKAPCNCKIGESWADAAKKFKPAETSKSPSKSPAKASPTKKNGATPAKAAASPKKAASATPAKKAASPTKASPVGKKGATPTAKAASLTKAASPKAKSPSASPKKAASASPKKAASASPKKAASGSPKKAASASPKKAASASPKKAASASPKKSQSAKRASPTKVGKK